MNTPPHRIDGDFENEVLRRRVQLLYEHLPFVLIGNALAGIGFAALLWHASPPERLLPWMALFAVIVILRAFSFRIFLRQAHFDVQTWSRLAVASAALSGGIWGIAGVALFNPDPAVLVTFAIILGGIASGSLAAYSAYLPTYVLFVVPAVLPFIVRCLVEGERLTVIFGLLSLASLLLHISYGRNHQRTVVESIRLRFENITLLHELQEQKEIAELASAAKTRLLAAASHDLRQPVQAIELFADILGHDLHNHPSRKLVDKLRRAIRNMEALLHAMLDYSRLDGLAIQPDIRDFPLAPLFARIHADLSIRADKRNLRLRVVPTGLWARSDPLLLERILRNLVENALKYTPKGGIVIGCRRAGSGLRIEVHDTGVGIPQEAQREIFREFFQLDNPERDQAKGLGLGLAIARGLARLLDHPLSLRSCPGRGSTFSIELPRGTPSASGVAEERQAPEVNLLADKTILLVDDDANIRTGIAELLERWDCTAVTAESPQEAIDLMRAAEFIPDALVTDYRLRRGTTGLDVIQAIHTHCGPLPTAIITGDTAPDRLREAQASGFPLLHKPIKAAALRRLLTNLVTNDAAHS